MMKPDEVAVETLSIPQDVQAELLAISEQRDEAIRKLEELSTKRLETKHRAEHLADRQNELLRQVRHGESTTLFDPTGGDEGEPWEPESPEYASTPTDDGADAELEATVGE